MLSVISECLTPTLENMQVLALLIYSLAAHHSRRNLRFIEPTR